MMKGKSYQVSSHWFLVGNMGIYYAGFKSYIPLFPTKSE